MVAFYILSFFYDVLKTFEHYGEKVKEKVKNISPKISPKS